MFGKCSSIKSNKCHCVGISEEKKTTHKFICIAREIGYNLVRKR